MFSWTPAVGQAGTYPITLTADDTQGGVDSVTFTVTVEQPTGLLAQNLAPPTKLSIAALAPNPFRREVQFLVGTPTAADGTVSVWDAAGRRVAVVAAKHLTAGYTLLTWDGRTAAGRNAAAGQYLLRVEAGGRASVRRVIKID